MRRGALTGRRRSPRGATIEMAPLIDMVFILLIFYIVSTSFVQDAGVTIDRPESQSALPVRSHYLPVAIAKAGSVHVAGKTIVPDNAAAITAALSDAGTKLIVIQADRDVPTALLLRVWDTCKQAGAEKVNIAAIAE